MIAAGAETASPVSQEELRVAVQREYDLVAREPEQDFHFHTGRPLTRILGYDSEQVEAVPESSVASFAGTGNPFRGGTIEPGASVVDVGAGAGMDSFIAASMVGRGGQVVGVDMTEAMLARARAAANDAQVDNVVFLRGFGEELPLEDAWADVVISNGVFNLMPDKLAAAREMYRTLRPGGRLQVADILVQKAVSEKAKERIDLWTG